MFFFRLTKVLLGRPPSATFRALTRRCRILLTRLAPRSPAKDRRELELSVDLLYRVHLGRPAEPEALKAHVPMLLAGTPLSSLARIIEHSPEAKARRHGTQLFDSLPDGEFIVRAAELLFHNRGVLPTEVEHWKRFLNEDRTKRIELIKGAVTALLENKQAGPEKRDASQLCSIMGTNKILSKKEWEALSKKKLKSRVPAQKTRSDKAFQHSGAYTVSAIASLYRGRRYIENFLKNITSQTIFDQSELIIIDAASPEGECEIIFEYQKHYPNIVYRRIEYPIGIYDAWNLGIELARGKYLTTTNLDDLRRKDSFALQAAALDDHQFADVAYQDFFYSFDSSLSFDDVAAVGIKSELPIVTPYNLLSFNSPHNAPMWRKSLHEELGLFDISFRSAGDWEFWLRCAHHRKTFLKINTPHVVYFHNPDGISTRAETMGIEEGRRVLRMYSEKLLAKELRMSRDDLKRSLKRGEDWPDDLSDYEVVQRELCHLRQSLKAN